MKNRFLLSLALMVSLAGAAWPQIVDDTESGVSDQVLILRERQTGIRRAKAILEKTFTFPKDATYVRLTMEDMRDSLHGSYSFYGRTIKINSRHQASSYAALITFHEVGHWFDNRVLAPRFLPGHPETVLASEANAPQLAAYRAAIKNSRTWHGLDALLKSPNTKKGSSREAYLKYVMSDAEMFARAYCNYMVAKSGDADLQKQMLTFTQNDWPWNGAFYPEDFKPIEKALDELFSKNGWLKTARQESP